jgi:hypothetical protein
MFSSGHVVMSVKWIQSEQAHQQRSASLRRRGWHLRKKKAINIKSNDKAKAKGSETKTYHQCERWRDPDARDGHGPGLIAGQLKERKRVVKDKNSNNRWLMTGQRVNSLTLGPFDDDVGSMSDVKA